LIFNAGEEAKVKGSRLPLLFDGSNGLNLLFKMTPWSYKLVRKTVCGIYMIQN
jgi:hypothetical protein